MRVKELGDEQFLVAQSMMFNAFNAMQQSYVGEMEDANPHLKERTDFFPNGLQRDAKIVVTDADNPVVFEQMEQYRGGVYTLALPLNALAGEIASTLHPELSYSVNPSKILKLAPGTQRLVTIEVSMGNHKAAESIREEHQAPGEMLSIDQYIASLPEVQRRNLEQQIDSILKLQRERKANTPHPAPISTGGGSPPPL
jgi:hypothetical protein